MGTDKNNWQQPTNKPTGTAGANTKQQPTQRPTQTPTGKGNMGGQQFPKDKDTTGRQGGQGGL